LNLACSKVGNPPVYDNATFPWAKKIEAAAPDIRTELERVLVRKNELPNFHDIAADVRSISTAQNWKTFSLMAFATPSEPNIALTPKTWAELQNIPGLRTAMFSIFEPGKHLAPHRGPYNGVLRLHLGLIVPEQSDRLAIRVDKQVCHWQEGKV